MDIDCGPHKQGRVDCVAGLDVNTFLTRNRSLLIYKASFSGKPVLAYEYAPLAMVARLDDGQLRPASDAAQAPLVAARVAWRQGMMACDGANATFGASAPFVQPRGDGQGAAHWWIGPLDATPWTVPMLMGKFPQQAALATQLAMALHACRDSSILHGNINPWAFVQSADGGLNITASLPDERGFLPFLNDNDSLWQPGFSPPEMADGAKRLPLGPWTDVYGLSALMYQAITGAAPSDWARAGDPNAWRSDLSARLDGLCLPKVQKVIIAGLSLDYAERPQTAQLWHQMMDVGALQIAASRPIDLAKPDPAAPPVTAANPPESPSRGTPAKDAEPPKGFGLRHAVLGLLLLGAAGWAASGLFAPAPPTDSAEVAAPDTAEEPMPQEQGVIEAGEASEPASPMQDPTADAITEAARDVAEPAPQIQIVPAPARSTAPPPPVVILSPSRPTQQASRATPRIVVSPTPRATMRPTPPQPAPSFDSEAETTRRLNAQQAAAARRQNEQNRANAEAERRAKAERERKILAEQEAYRQRQAATEAERVRREREYQAAQTRWRADVAACKAGDRSRCAK